MDVNVIEGGDPIWMLMSLRGVTPYGHRCHRGGVAPYGH